MRTTAELARLRVRLTLLYTVTAAVGLLTLAIVTTVVEARLRAERLDEELVGWASRAASLVDDATGGLDPAAITDDVIQERVVWSAYAPDAAGELTVIGGRDDMVGARPMAERAVRDDEEQGTVGDVVIDGEQRRAAAMPLYVDDEARGAVVVAATGAPDDDQLVVAVWVATVGLIGLGGLMGWWFAGRSIRPAAASLEQHEQFLAAAAHELRTPMARVRAVAESASLLTDGDESELSGELVRLRTLTSEATSVVEQLLLIARVDAGSVVVRPESVDVASLAASLAADHPTLEVAIAGGLHVTADRALLRLAIENLVSNAERHGSADGHPPAIRLIAGAAADGAAITVCDDGPGIADALLPEIFDRFRSNVPGGSGVGLWLVRWIAEQHGGTVGADRGAGGRGACFTIRLPA